jgi:hypothetical protein
MPASSQQSKKGSGRVKKAIAGRKVFVVATNPAYAKLCRASVTRLGKQSKVAVNFIEFQDWLGAKGRSQRTGSTSQTLFISRLADISEESAKQTRAAAGAKYLLFPEGMPVEALASRLSWLDIRNEHRLHVAHEEKTEQIVDVIYRLLSGVAQTDGAKPIVDAWVENENLVVLPPSFERLSVPLKKLEAFIGKDSKKVRDFEIDEDGSFLYWQHADVHLGWEQLLQLVDPTAALAAKQKTVAFNQRYGAAIRSLREERGLSQTAIEGLTDRHLRRIELGQQAATTASLKALAGAHGMELSEYMNEIATRLS